MNYESMSDFEINKAVAVSLGFEVRVSSWAIAARDESVPYCEFLKGDVYYINTPRNNVDLPNYCNNPSDSWPIMLENGIAPLAESGRVYGATTDTYEYYEPHGNVIYSCEDKNPLRAAMIVFLMMSES